MRVTFHSSSPYIVLLVYTALITPDSIIALTVIKCTNLDMKTLRFECMLMFLLIDTHYFCRRLVVDFERPIHIEKLYRKFSKTGEYHF